MCLGILLVSLASAVFSVAPGVSLLHFLKMASWISALLLGLGWGKTSQARENLPLIFLIGGLGVCATGYFFWIFGTQQGFNMSSTFYQSDVFAGYLLLLIPLAASLALFSEDRARAILYSGVTFFYVLTLFFTYSRGGILVFLLSALFFCMVLYRRRPYTLKFVFGLLILVGISAALYLLAPRGSPLLARLVERAASPRSWYVTLHSRLSFWKGGWAIFATHPWLGSGPDTFGRLFPMHQENFLWYSRFPHNFYVQLLSDNGIFLFLLTCLLMFLVLRSGLAQLDRTESYPMMLGLVAGFLAGSLHLFLDVDSNFTAWSAHFWGMGGLILARDPRWSQGDFRGRVRVLVSFLFLVFLLLQTVVAFSAFLDRQASRLALSGQYEKALDRLGRAIRVFPLDGALFERRARLETELFPFPENPTAEKDLREALRLDPYRPLYLGELSRLKLHQGNRQEARRLLERALQLDPHNYPQHWVRLADLDLLEGDAPKAERAYRDVLARFPEVQVARLQLFRKDDYRMALGSAHLGLAKSALKKNDLVEADREIAEALRFSKENPEANYLAGLRRMEAGDWREAAAFFERALYDPVLGPEPWKWLALARLKLGKSARGLEAIREALRFKAQDAMLLLIAGDLYAQAGQTLEARRWWTTGLKDAPHNSVLRERLYSR